MRISSIALAAVLFCAPLQAQLLEDFESGNLNAYTIVNSGTNANVVNAAAYLGSFGLEFGAGSAGWYYRTNATAQPGDIIRCHAQINGSGRLYIGFAANSGGCWSAVLASNTTELLLQQNIGYGYSNQSNVAQSYPGGVWNQVEIDWALDGTVVVNLYDAAGVTLINSTPPVQGPTTGGGIAFRGFGAAIYLDEITNNTGNFPSFCDGSEANPGCPCGNLSDGSVENAGCANSMGNAGALLDITGFPVISGSTLQLTGTGLAPLSTGIFFQGMNVSAGGQGSFLGDGRLCAGGQLVRLQVLNSDAQGSIQSSIDVPSIGGITVPGTRVYQLWYMDTGGPCGSGVNLTNAREVTWIP